MKLISLDIETWGLKDGYTLQPWRVKTNEAGILCMSFFNGKELNFVCNSSANLTFLTFDSTFIYCGWNLKFDMSWINIPKSLIYLDGMLLLKRIMPDLESYGLKQTLKKFADKINFNSINVTFDSKYSDEIVFKSGIPEAAYNEEELEKLYNYNQLDAKYTYALIQYLISISSKENLKQAIRESTISILFGEAWANGININIQELEAQEKKIICKLAHIENLLSKNIALSSKILASPKQLREFLQYKLNVKLKNITPTGAYSVNSASIKDAVLHQEGRNKKILQAIGIWKSLKTEYDKFIRCAYACIKDLESYVIHPTPFLHETYTGRMTYGVHQTIAKQIILKNGKHVTRKKRITLGLPIHQMKRGELRNLLIAPDGFQIAELDFSGQEMRLIAAIANEKTMLKLFNEGKDLHSYTAASIYGYTYDEFIKLKDNKQMRHVGKVTNLSLQYRLSAQNLYAVWHNKYDLITTTKQDAENARDTYLKIYKGIPQYWKSNIEFARNNNYVKNLAGKKYPLNKWDGNNKWKAEQTAINFPIQSTGAEQKILALCYLQPFIKKNNIQLAWDLHDGMFFYVPECDLMHELVVNMVNIASNLPYKSAWGWSPPLQFPVEAKIGKSWGNLKPINM